MIVGQSLIILKRGVPVQNKLTIQDYLVASSRMNFMTQQIIRFFRRRQTTCLAFVVA